MQTTLDNLFSFPSTVWACNGHIHTIARSLLGDTTIPRVERVEITTPDDDFLEIDCAINKESNSIIVLFHGLEGSSRRYYIVELMKELIEEQHSVVAVNFRSCGHKMNRRPRFYHSGETDDYKTVFSWLQKRYPDKQIGAVGFSLGGNALVKSLGEMGNSHPADVAVAVSVPYDLRLGSLLLSKGFHRIYEYRFLQTLQKKLATKRTAYPDLPEFNGATLYDFDDQVTAPVHGFNDADDYYKRCSGRRFIHDIQTPTLLIHSREDPLCPIEAMPIDKINDNGFTDYIITDRGGHVGFWSNPRGWLNYAIRTFISRKT
ncbi:YheT family hydrolase [Fodinibius halophilus]|uniref:Alpha/beta fold hydrolase n=1 Tax=Fodinibius halophilus TaxID=1736908 RepID=A0A6M1TGC0_9BACT|nr:alpha/beta fold hydrolase [Fodinibius halophilus]NGP89142.1 alpha/beta fold hydrolase [Fodinibius halophilus]